MKTKTIVDEVREIRERLAARFDFDIARIGADVQRRERKSGRRLIQPPKRATKGRQKITHK